MVCLILAASGLAACAAGAPPPARPGPYDNRYQSFKPKGLGALLRWRFEAWRDGLPPPAPPAPRISPDLAFIAANARAGSAMQPAVTWIGHATTLVQLGGLSVLTDPHFSERASPLPFAGPRRRQPPALALAELPHIDAVLISHNHYDHLDVASVRALAAQPGGPPRFLVPLGLAAWFADLGIEGVTELDWWQGVRIGGVDFVLTPVQHWSGRGLFDRMETLWGGWAMLADDFNVWFSGDTGYSPDFVDTRERLADRGGFDLALIAIGAYEPRWFMKTQHVNPAEAVQIHRDIGAAQSIGIHWGTFELTDEPLDLPPRDLAAAVQAQGLPPRAFTVLAIGETRRFPRRGAEPVRR